MPAPIDLTGQRFGRLVAVEPARAPGGVRGWRCRCACGGQTVVPTGGLRYGSVTSCGCARRESLGLANAAIAWRADEIDLLGTATDAAIAERVARSEGAVAQMRRSLGIAPHLPVRRFAWTPATDALLGTATDAEIAARLGVSRPTVRVRRRSLGVVAAFRRARRTCEVCGAAFVGFGLRETCGEGCATEATRRRVARRSLDVAFAGTARRLNERNDRGK